MKNSLNVPVNEVSNVRESFESQTTEGKNESIKEPEERPENPYGNIEESEHHQEYNDQNSRVSRQDTKTNGENSLPEIANSVVEDSLPFRGLENHYKAISKEGFSGANDTGFMKKTNENFYSSFKSKGNEMGGYQQPEESVKELDH